MFRHLALLTPALLAGCHGGTGDDPSAHSDAAVVQQASSEGESKLVQHIQFAEIDLRRYLDLKETSVTPDDIKTLPLAITELEGRQVMIEGDMYPSLESAALRTFVLVRVIQLMNIGGPVFVSDIIDVSLRDGVTTEYVADRPVTVIGAFEIAPETEGNEVVLLNRLTEASLQSQ
ncbi:MAG: hypothetical protein KF861_21500 [Planctomycetaceae bacterium]|nr:hypothetical protein [Planctomycetaceae bacterium]